MHAIYVRVSTEEQAHRGYSLDSQLLACRAKAKSLGLTGEFQEFVDDGYSGGFLERPALDRLRALLAEHRVETVTAYDPDRLARDLEHILVLDREIGREGARLFFVTGDYEASPTGKLFFAMRGAFAAYERALIRERTSRGRRQKAVQGKIVSNAHPYGYGFDAAASMYVVAEEQARVVRLIYSLCVEEGLGSRAIARELQRRGIAGPKGKPLSPVTVYKILSREMYCGQHYLFRQQVRKTGHNKRLVANIPREEWVPVRVPAIISRPVWEQAQLQLKRNRKQANRNCRRDYLLRGVLFCGLCGRAMVATTRCQASGAKSYAYYTCVTRESAHYALQQQRCQAMRIPVEQMDRLVWALFASIASKAACLRDFVENAELPDYAAETARLSQQHEELLNRHRQVAALIREGLLAIDAAREELRAANRELRAISAALQELQAAQASATGAGPSLSPDEFLHAATFQQKHAIIVRSGVRIFAARPARNRIEFYLD
ncbi:MAG TPA: recombinase family protein [Selenomonadales bacterium]|nr:recombinase family protein [Selenomonadales bacterium]